MRFLFYHWLLITLICDVKININQLILGRLNSYIKGLIEQFFPDNLEVGQVIWPAVSVDESHEQHKKIEDHKIIPVRLNLVTREDMEKLEKKVNRNEIEKTRAIRLFNEAYEQGALLTLADVGVLLGK